MWVGPTQTENAQKPESGIFGQYWPDLKNRVKRAQPEKKIELSRLNSTFSKKLVALANSDEFAISS